MTAATVLATAATATITLEAPDVARDDDGRGDAEGVVPGRYVGADDSDGDDVTTSGAARPG